MVLALLSALTFPQSLVIGAPGRAFIGLDKIWDGLGRGLPGGDLVHSRK